MRILDLLADKGSNYLCNRSWMGRIEYCNDGNQSDCVCEGKLRVLSAYGDSSESVGGPDCDGGSGGLISIKLELDFHCRAQQVGPEMVEIGPGTKKSSIGG